MAYLTRYVPGGFSPSTLIQSAQVDGELDQILAMINGTPTASQIKYDHNGATTGFILNNSGGGIIAAFQVAGTNKAYINSVGQWHSLLTTGTAPLKVDSTTLVANLNAASVQGISDPLSLSGASQSITGTATPELKIVGSTSSAFELDDSGEAGSSRFRIYNAAGDVKFQVYRDAGPFWVDILKIDISAETLQDGSGNTLATQTYVGGHKSTWSFGVFYAGAIDTSVVQAVWIIPNDEDLMQVERVRWLFQSGSPTGTSQIKLWHMNSSGVEQNSQTFSILVGDTALNTYDVDVNPNWSMASGDYLKWTVIADGGHQDISIHAQGNQSIWT
ncbi:MAG: hypothetical protein ACYS7Y_28630 [Planctomycetota bacterium]|jgi:hypothetical protein